MHAPAADAAEYEVVQCGSATAAHDFIPASSDPALYAQDRCSTVAGLSLNGVAGARTKANGAASWIAFAPDGTTFSSWEASFLGGSGGAGTAVYARACWDLGCASNQLLFYTLPEWGTPQQRQWQGTGAVMLQFALQCSFGSDGGCTLRASPPGGSMFSPRMKLTDHYGPASPNLTGGSLPGSSWRSGRQPHAVAFTAADRGGGVDHVTVSIDAANAATYSAPCARTTGGYTRLLPCPLTTNASLPIDIAKLSDGSHTMSLTTVDAAEQASTTGPYTLRVDNTPPAAPRNLTVVGGDAWRSTDGFDLRWDLPDKQHAPITMTHWRLCPVKPGPCRTGQSNSLTGLNGLLLGASGGFTLRTSLEDAAGNHDADSAAVTMLRLDSDPPQPRFEKPDAADPLRLTVDVEEPLSGLAGGSIELRQAGTDAWVALDTAVAGSRLVAHLDDERFADGSYELRARAVDRAGNESTTLSREDGTKAELQLPIRIPTRIRAGARRVVLQRKSGRRTSSRRRTVLVKKLRTLLGARPRLEGSLTDAAGHPLANVDIAVSSAEANQAVFRPAGLVRTDESGRFSYRARSTRSRTVRFHYSGSEHVRSSSADVTLGVAASSTIRASDRTVRNGETVRFSGTLRTLPVPVAGKLLEMQAFFRDRWRTFSTVRSDRRGHWSFDYGFGGTVGKVIYLFRVHIPREGGYPFEDGNSRVASVTVRGP